MGYDPVVASGGHPESDHGRGADRHPGGERRREADSGVVEPLRLPDGVVRAWHRSLAWSSVQPSFVWLFVGLAGADVFMRGLGVVGPPIFLDLRAPVGIVASFLPHDLLILLPALLVIRRPGAVAETPNIVDGAILVAFVELLSNPSTAIAAEIGGLGPWAVLSIVTTALGIVGWVMIGRGLTTLNGDPSPTVAGWANLAALGIVAGVIAMAATFRSGTDFGEPELSGLMSLNTIVRTLAPLALAYVGRAVIRGIDDERRPRGALRLGATAVLIAAGLGLFVNLVSLVATVNVGFGQAISGFPGWAPLYWLSAGGAVTLLVVAFGLGLADDGQPAPDQLVTLEAR
jgi:hypothetical protein